MWENSRAIRESAEFQINFKPLSPVKAKPQQLSCCDLILFFALSPLFFSTPKTVSFWGERQQLSAKDTCQESRIFPEPPPPQYGHLLDQVWGQYLQAWVRNQERVQHTSTCHIVWCVSVSHCCCRIIKTLWPFFLTIHLFYILIATVVEKVFKLKSCI